MKLSTFTCYDNTLLSVRLSQFCFVLDGFYHPVSTSIFTVIHHTVTISPHALRTHLSHKSFPALIELPPLTLNLTYRA